MKTIAAVLVCVASILVFFSASIAIELTDPSKVPSIFATAVEKEGKKEIVFGTGATSYEPKVLNQILSGYGR